MSRHGKMGGRTELEEDRKLAREAAAMPEATVPAFMVAKAPGGYVAIEYALPTSVAERYLVKRAPADVRVMAIERVLARLDEEHDT